MSAAYLGEPLRRIAGKSLTPKPVSTRIQWRLVESYGGALIADPRACAVAVHENDNQ